jgi:hypothetical protein
MARKKYNHSRQLAWSLALEAAANQVYAALGNDDSLRWLVEEHLGNEDDIARVQDFQEQVIDELRQRAAKIRARLG